MQKTTATTIQEYNKLQVNSAEEICNYLESIINKSLRSGDSKIWHGSPVWFIDENPIVSYSVRKGDKVSLMFFSGQSFDEKNLKPLGKFKAAEILYTEAKEIKITNLKKWLKKAKVVQWDYKNIVKRKGVLQKLIINKK